MSCLTNQGPVLSWLTNQSTTLDTCVCVISGTSDICTRSQSEVIIFCAFVTDTSLDVSVLDLFLHWNKIWNIPLLWIMNVELSNIWFLLVHFPLFNKTDTKEQMRKIFCLFVQSNSFVYLLFAVNLFFASAIFLSNSFILETRSSFQVFILTKRLN